jgi:hypothetical protein
MDYPADDLHVEPVVVKAIRTLCPLCGAPLMAKGYVAVRGPGTLPQIGQKPSQGLTILRLVGASQGVSTAPASVERIQESCLVCRKLFPDGDMTSNDMAGRAPPVSPLIDNFFALARPMFGSVYPEADYGTFRTVRRGSGHRGSRGQSIDISR